MAPEVLAKEGKNETIAPPKMISLFFLSFVLDSKGFAPAAHYSIHNPLRVVYDLKRFQSAKFSIGRRWNGNRATAWKAWFICLI